jgi:hypothetical protein
MGRLDLMSDGRVPLLMTNPVRRLLALLCVSFPRKAGQLFYANSINMSFPRQKQVVR